ncbi:uncharacterized protein EV420DRAFT_1639512 [Desarmillaria tabescens]|uniref:Uncharacterized protein n=1 Tax=Armillaria tabescens TaxID=1929756 RepID=A0AA39NB46_ARMTA|nr:uncharacterized protein EV420DRAFT_1639512 [Desarmillaria tabescens]KAK0462304.1 hypothetical protein EV420DRAFT_1639512 [Desarmillaria tabescens]
MLDITDELDPDPENQFAAQLRSGYSFICSCAACRPDTKRAEASDERRARIHQLVEEITPGNSAWRKPSYEKMKECLEVVEKVRLDIYRAQILFYGGTLLLQLGDITHFLRWMKRAKEEYRRFEGETSPTFKAIKTTSGRALRVEVQAAPGTIAFILPSKML